MEQKLVKIQNVALKHPPRSMENYTYRLRERSYKKALQEFRLCRRKKVFITNSDFPAHHCKNSVFAFYVFHVSVNCCTYFPFFLVKKRLLPNYADMYISEPTLHHKLCLNFQHKTESTLSTVCAPPWKERGFCCCCSCETE